MESIGRRGEITVQALEIARPGFRSWLALFLFLMGLGLMTKFGTLIVEHAAAKEWLVNASSLALLDGTILSLSLLLTAGMAVAAWRVWWAFSLLGTLALGLPDIAGNVGAPLVAFSVTAARSLAATGKLCLSAMSKGFRWMGRPLEMVWLWALLLTGYALIAGVGCSSSALSLGITALLLLLRPLARVTRGLLFALWWPILATSRVMQKAVRYSFRILWRAVVAVTTVALVPLRVLGRGSSWLLRLMGKGLFIFGLIFRFLRRLGSRAITLLESVSSQIWKGLRWLFAPTAMGLRLILSATFALLGQAFSLATLALRGGAVVILALLGLLIGRLGKVCIALAILGRWCGRPSKKGLLFLLVLMGWPVLKLLQAAAAVRGPVFLAGKVCAKACRSPLKGLGIGVVWVGKGLAVVLLLPLLPLFLLGGATVILWRVLSPALVRLGTKCLPIARAIGAGISIVVNFQVTGIRSVLVLVGLGLSTATRVLLGCLSLLSKLVLRMLKAGTALVARSLAFTFFRLPVAAAMVALSPLLLVKLAINAGYRRQVFAQLNLWLLSLKTRPAIALLSVGILGSFGLAAFLITPLFPPVSHDFEVVIWSTPDQQEVMRRALEHFNGLGQTLSLDGKEYSVRARLVTKSSEQMHFDLMAQIAGGQANPDSSNGRPVVITPSTTSWIHQLNQSSGYEVFRADDRYSPIARTPVVVLTYREMAECLGWGDLSVGWQELLEVMESGNWPACPQYRAEWGAQPLLTMPDSTSTAVGRTTMEIFYNVGSDAKSSKQGEVTGAKNPQDLIERYMNVAARKYAHPDELQDMLLLGPSAIQFAPVEEYHIPQFYRLQEESGARNHSNRELVAIYPKDGTMWHYHSFGVIDAPWVEEQHRQAARLVGEYLRSSEVQTQFMEAGFRPGIYLSPKDTLTPSRGLDLNQPRVFFSPTGTEKAEDIREIWERAVQNRPDAERTREVRPDPQKTSYLVK